MTLTRRHLIMLGIAVGAVALWLAADRLIMTDKKRIRRAISQMASAVERGDIEGIFKHVSPLYVDDAHSYAKLRVAAELFLGNYPELSLSVRDVQVKITGDIAVAQVRVLGSQAEEGTSVSTWQLNFQREPDGRWLVISLMPLRINAQDVDGWRGLYHSR